MIQAIVTRIKQGYRTIPFPRTQPTLPERFRGLPIIDKNKCSPHCKECVNVCPTDAIDPETTSIDMGKCIFCTACTSKCQNQSISFSREYRLAGSDKKNLIVHPNSLQLPRINSNKTLVKLYHNSLKLRQVSAGGCNACEADINVLTTIVFDLGRFGVQIVASPRHADGLLVTGPVTENMRVALLKTYEAVPDPRIVIAVGACAISGGIFRDHPQQHNGVDTVLPVDVFIPGCPPHPFTILDAILRIIDKTK